MADTRKPPAGAPPSQDKTETEAAQPAAAGGKKAADNTPATREDIAAMRFEVGEMAMQFADGMQQLNATMERMVLGFEHTLRGFDKVIEAVSQQQQPAQRRPAPERSTAPAPARSSGLSVDRDISDRGDEEPVAPSGEFRLGPGDRPPPGLDVPTGHVAVRLKQGHSLKMAGGKSASGGDWIVKPARELLAPAFRRIVETAEEIEDNARKAAAAAAAKRNTGSSALFDGFRRQAIQQGDHMRARAREQAAADVASIRPSRDVGQDVPMRDSSPPVPAHMTKDFQPPQQS